MVCSLPTPKIRIYPLQFWRKVLRSKRARYSLASVIDLILIVLILLNGLAPAQTLISPLISPTLKPLTATKNTQEVFGFAPYWTLDKLDNVNFNVLTTLAYFGVEVGGDGNLLKDDPGYQHFLSEKVTKLFQKAHQSGTRVVLTLTQMSNDQIINFLDNEESQIQAISQAVAEVQKRGIDGLNVDFEFDGDPGPQYRVKFNQFVSELTRQMHQENSSAKVTVSVYAASAKEPKIYDVATLAKVSDGLFMMAYDFAGVSADHAIPTAPLYGKETARKYWYDIASAVVDFLKIMPAQKLILGVPYYGYNYLVYAPQVKAETRPLYSWRGRPKAQTYSVVQDDIKPEMTGVDAFFEGRDPDSQVPFKAYHVAETDTWRMVFADDKQSLALKYDFAREKNLAGVGIWALGFDEGKQELWQLLAEKFGTKLAAND